MAKVLMAEVNISEGTNLDLVNKVKEAFLQVKGIELVDIDSNEDHNRTVFTYKGEPEKVLDATKRLAQKAIALLLEAKKQAQVAMNMINYEKTPIHRVLETIKSEANRYNVNIVDTELIGPVPIYVIRDIIRFLFEDIR